MMCSCRCGTYCAAGFHESSTVCMQYLMMSIRTWLSALVLCIVASAQVVTVVANDLDDGINSRLTYSFGPAVDPELPFFIDGEQCKS